MVNVKLLPGDCLLYSGNSLFSWLIFIKTWSSISHVEIYVGNGKSWASRDSLGVNEYPFRSDGLVKILRPNQPLDWINGKARFNKIYKGQKYDWRGLIRFAWRKKVIPDSKDNAQFCSEFGTRIYRDMGMKNLFNGFDADAIAPWFFLLDCSFTDITSGELINA